MGSNPDPLSPPHRSPYGADADPLDKVFHQLRSQNSIGGEHERGIDVRDFVGWYEKFKEIHTPKPDPLRFQRFWAFVVVAVLCTLVGSWIAIDPNNKHPKEHESAGLAAVVAALTGLGGLAAR